MSFLVLSSSLNPNSRSRDLARRAAEYFDGQDATADFVDLQEYTLPLCDAADCYGHETVKELGLRIRNAEGILVAVPIYNYDVGASIKNLVELTGSAWDQKVVAFLCSAGGKSSYMSVMGFANSLMLDFRSVIVPRFVYVEDSSYDDGGALGDPLIEDRIREVTETLVRFSRALATDAS